MSTFTSYMLLTRDYSRTLSNLAKNTQIANQASYYQANIGKVKSVDDLMKNGPPLFLRDEGRRPGRHDVR